MRSGDFDELVLWLEQRLGRRLSAELSGPVGQPTNVGLEVEGGLLRDDRTILRIDAAPGRVAAYKVGDGRLVLLEGELVRVDWLEPQPLTMTDGTTALLGAGVEAAFRYVRVLLREVVAL